MHRIAFTLLALALIAIPSTADAEYRQLCTSVPGACEYSPANVPKLLADVCHDPSNNAITLKGAAACQSGSRTYTVIYGEVLDSLTGEVAAYIPLDDACAAGRCAAYVPHENPQAYGMCCQNGGPCWPGNSCGGVLYWCNDGVCNDDGTVTCFEAEML
jgi:hypothetical protein